MFISCEVFILSLPTPRSLPYQVAQRRNDLEFTAGAQQSRSIVWHFCRRQESVTLKNKSIRRNRAGPGLCLLQAEVLLITVP